MDPRTGARTFVDSENPAPKWTPPEHPDAQATANKVASPLNKTKNLKAPN